MAVYIMNIHVIIYHWDISAITQHVMDMLVIQQFNSNLESVLMENIINKGMNQ